ncbi:MAG: High-affinity Na(+)/H(+) antiporter NhaS3 [Chlamydiae bacterium]|nr:High-affinity Na(+)/H(+) antiporter NhaS3 [Chlamydiota bacterium]
MENIEIASPVAAVLLVGILVSASFWTRIFFKKIKLPPIAGYIILGVILRLFGSTWNNISSQTSEFLYFLGEIGIVTLLFRIGLGCNLKGLLEQLRTASFLAFTNILVSAVLGFCAAYYLLSISLIPSLFVGVALTATSIGVAIMSWQQENALDSRSGKILVDMAALDDIVAIALMGLLFTLVPVLREESYEALFPLILSSVSIFSLKLMLFALFCMFFSYFMEAEIMAYLRKFERKTDPILMTVSIGFIIAAIAAIFGFSLSLGAFFAGISFSRDPKSRTMETSFVPLEDFFVPFFFIGIGYQASVEVLFTNYHIVIVLLACAIIGKVVGTVLPALLSRISFARANILGISMIPRAEIAMVITAKAFLLGYWALPKEVYTSMVIVSLVTCLATPLALKVLLKRFRSAGIEEL